VTLLERAAAYYADHGWPSAPTDDGAGLTLHIRGSEAEWSALAVVDEHPMRFVFYSLGPVEVPQERRAAVADYLHRANLGLVSDAFELDMDSGEVRLRSGADLFDLPPALRTEELLTWVVADLSASNVATFDRYLAGLVAVALGDSDPREVIAEVEATPA
jgi:hypothetical protein